MTTTITPTEASAPVQGVPAPQAPETQQSTNEAPEKTQGQDDVAKRYYLLAKKEQALRSHAREVKAREAQMSARETEIRAQVEREYRERFRTNPLEEITNAGLSWDDITAQAISNPPPSKEAIELQQLKQELESIKKFQEESTTQQYEQAKNQIRNDVRLLIQGDDRFETIQAMDGAEEVVNLIEYVFQQDGVILDLETAAEEVENYLFEERASKIASLKKVQSKFQPQQVQATSEPHRQTAGRPVTLTNGVGASGKPLSARDRAIMAFKGQLK